MCFSQADCRMHRESLYRAQTYWHMAPKRSRKRPSSSLDADVVVSGEDLHRKLADCGSSKTSLITAIDLLGKAGWLTQEACNKNETTGTRRQLRNAIASHASATTPYGRVIQRMSLPHATMKHWDFVHPLAFLHYMGGLSKSFFDVMKDCWTPGVPLRIVLYIDEICPGNPLRPEKSRTLQAIYWSIIEWPTWMLQRTATWPVFGTLRSTIVEQLPGSVPYLMSRVLQVFFSAEGHSMTNGVTIVNAREDLLITAKLGGFLADEKALKELGDSKGASGHACAISMVRTCTTIVHIYEFLCACVIHARSD